MLMHIFEKVYLIIIWKNTKKQQMNVKRPSSWHQQAQNINKGLAHRISQDNQQDAIKIFEREIELDPTCIEAYYHLGKAFYKDKQSEKALKVYDQIIINDLNELNGHIGKVINFAQKKVNYIQLWKGLGRLYQVFKEFWIQILTTKLQIKGSSFYTEKGVRITLIILYNGLKLDIRRARQQLDKHKYQT